MSDSGSSDGESAPSLKPTLSTLPLEIKARIAELASLQDVRYKERWVPGAPGEALVKALRNEWSGRSLVALAQTCSVFNDLAAKHLFHSLHYTKFNSAYFSLRILPRHAHRIRSVIFDPKSALPSSIDITRRQLAVLPYLPNLSTLRLDSFNLKCMMAGLVRMEGVLDHSPDNLDAAACLDVLRDVLGRLESLELVGFATAESMLPVLELCPRIQSIDISNIRTTTRTGAEALGRHLANLPKLRSLSISALDLVHSEWADQEWACPIESLKLASFDELMEPHIKFIDRLAPTLRHLDLSFLDRLESKDDEPPLLLQPLPSLVSLSLHQCTPIRLNPVLLAVSAATQPLSKVHHLDVNATKLYVFAYTVNGLDAFQKAAPNLRSMRLISIRDTARGGPSSSFRRDFDRLEKAGVVVPRECWDDAIVYPDDPPKPWASDSLDEAQVVTMDRMLMEAHLETQHSALKRALEFGLRRIDDMRVSWDHNAMRIAIASLGPIWGMKLLEDD
ncbi:hypothetical protein RQP46_008100 [Phenoliferia psychrophenolica]